MNAITNVKSKITMAKAVVNAKLRMFFASMAAMLSVYCPAVGTLCAADTMSIVTKMIDIICEVARYTGILMAVGGIFMLVLAYKDDNADQQARAIRLIVVAGVMIGLKAMITGFGLLS